MHSRAKAITNISGVAQYSATPSPMQISLIKSNMRIGRVFTVEVLSSISGPNERSLLGAFFHSDSQTLRFRHLHKGQPDRMIMAQHRSPRQMQTARKNHNIAVAIHNTFYAGGWNTVASMDDICTIDLNAMLHAGCVSVCGFDNTKITINKKGCRHHEKFSSLWNSDYSVKLSGFNHHGRDAATPYYA